MDNLDPKERELLESYNRDEWRSVKGREPDVEKFRDYAR
jgi:hypothetical protein